MPPPRGLVQQLDQELHRQGGRRESGGGGGLKPGMSLLLACSGGADSVALVRLLHRINESNYWRWNLAIAHINHNMRGRRSDADERFVKTLGKKLGLRVYVRKVRVPTRSEAEARKKRFTALADILKKMKKPGQDACIVMGHQLEDQVETILLKLARGSGVRGVAGIAGCVKIDGVSILRPLLGLSRSQLRMYLAEIQQPWREDHTNASTRYRRNLIRHEILPILLKVNPQAMANIARFGQLARSYAQAVEREAARGERSRKRISRKDEIELDRSKLQRISAAARGLILRRAMVAVGGGQDTFDSNELQQAIKAVRQPRSNLTFQFAGGIQIVIQRDHLLVQRKK